MVNVKPNLLVVEDDVDIAEMLEAYFQAQEYSVHAVNWGEQAVEYTRNHHPDLILLDIRLPDIDGFEVASRLRKNRRTADIPIIFLTDKRTRASRLKGLELGADDYITKPFSPRELVSRVKAVLRRTEASGFVSRDVYQVDEYLRMDFGRREIWVGGKLIKLRPTEYRLLYHLVQNAGWVMTYDQLLSKVWGYEYRDEPHYVRLYVNYLRQKIEPDPANPKYILTERGVGYRFIDFNRESAEGKVSPD
jgi:two-component system KDP operon response regulator KdpE